MRRSTPSRSRALALLTACPIVLWAIIDCGSGAGGSTNTGPLDAGHSQPPTEGGQSNADGPVSHLEAGGGDAGRLGPACTDCDHDGYVSPEDCNDFDALVNPDAYDFVGDGIDNDCDGKVDDPVVTCETIPLTAPGSPLDFARAADLCAQIATTHTGKPYDPVVNAAWGQVQGLGANQTLWTSKTKTEQIDIVSSFGGNEPQLGKTMFGLSNGPWGTSTPRTSPALDPVGFNLSNACADIPLLGDDCLSLTGNKSAGGVSVQDWAELTLDILVPVNAGGLSFDFAFFSSEFNEWWQSSANDAFFALVTSKTIHGTNVARDASGLGVTVNSGFFQLCPTTASAPASLEEPQALAQCVGVNGSSAVPGTLGGTGYDGAGAGSTNDTTETVEGQTYIYGGGTGWLRASFGVTPSEELSLRIVIMDTFDGIKDSVVLIDHFAWQPLNLGDAAAAGGGVTRPPK
jgi:hypothetical protein